MTTVQNIKENKEAQELLKFIRSKTNANIIVGRTMVLGRWDVVELTAVGGSISFLDLKDKFYGEISFKEKAEKWEKAGFTFSLSHCTSSQGYTLFIEDLIK